MSSHYPNQQPEGYQGESYEARGYYQEQHNEQATAGYGPSHYNAPAPASGYGENQSYYQQAPYGNYPPPQGSAYGESHEHQGQQYGSYQNAHDSQMPAYPSGDQQYRESSYQQQPQYGGYHSPPPSQGFHSTPPNDAWVKQEAHTPDPNAAYPQYQHPNQPQGPYDPNAPEGERGILGALAGGAAGAYGGHKIGHGFLGTVGGAYAGHKLEDAYKDHKKHSRPSSRRSSSSSSSSDEGKHHHHKGPQYAGNFSASSRHLSLHGTDLHAECRERDRDFHWTRIDLNRCLTNNNGHFEWRRDGNFGASARNLRLIDNGRTLEAELADTNHHWRLSRVALDEMIENNNGELRLL